MFEEIVLQAGQTSTNRENLAGSEWVPEGCLKQFLLRRPW